MSELNNSDEFNNELIMQDDSFYDAEIEAIKERVKEMEADASKLHEIKNNPAKNALIVSDEDKSDIDLRSICVRNVEYGTSAEELEKYFRHCGPVNRVTILCNKATGQPKGFAYIEFDQAEAIEAAMALDGTTFRARPLNILPKRTNIPGMSTTNRFPRGRFRGRGFMRGFGGRSRFGRGRRRGYFYAPY